MRERVAMVVWRTKEEAKRMYERDSLQKESVASMEPSGLGNASTKSRVDMQIKDLEERLVKLRRLKELLASHPEIEEMTTLLRHI